MSYPTTELPCTGCGVTQGPYTDTYTFTHLLILFCFVYDCFTYYKKYPSFLLGVNLAVILYLKGLVCMVLTYFFSLSLFFLMTFCSGVSLIFSTVSTLQNMPDFLSFGSYHLSPSLKNF